MFCGPLPVPSLVSCDFIPVLCHQLTAWPWVGFSLKPLFPHLGIGAMGPSHPQEPFWLRVPKAGSPPSSAARFSGLPPSTLLCPLSGLLQWPDPPPAPIFGPASIPGDFVVITDGRNPGRKDIFSFLSRLHIQHGGQHGAQSHNPEIMTLAKIKTRTFNQLNHSGTSPFFKYFIYLFMRDT